jgi:hypothetical protein
MDLAILGGITMLVVWAIGTFAFDAPGWINALLTFGVALIIWRVVARATPRPPAPPAPRDNATAKARKGGR